MATQQLRAIWHPTRAQLLELVMKGPTTQSQMVKAAGGSAARVSYHSRVLCSAGCIQVAESSSPDSDDPVYEAV